MVTNLNSFVVHTSKIHFPVRVLRILTQQTPFSFACGLLDLYIFTESQQHLYYGSIKVILICLIIASFASVSYLWHEIVRFINFVSTPYINEASLCNGNHFCAKKANIVPIIILVPSIIRNIGHTTRGYH